MWLNKENKTVCLPALLCRWRTRRRPGRSRSAARSPSGVLGGRGPSSWHWTVGRTSPEWLDRTASVWESRWGGKVRHTCLIPEYFIYTLHSDKEPDQNIFYCRGLLWKVHVTCGKGSRTGLCASGSPSLHRCRTRTDCSLMSSLRSRFRLRTSLLCRRGARRSLCGWWRWWTENLKEDSSRMTSHTGTDRKWLNEQSSVSYWLVFTCFISALQLFLQMWTEF